MRFAMRISPSRVSNSTVPISRMYMRTGSVVRPNSASTVASACGRFLGRVLVVRYGGVGKNQRLGVRCLLVHRDAHIVDHVDDVFDLLGIDDLARQMVVDLAVREVTLLLAFGDEQLQLRLTFVFLELCLGSFRGHEFPLGEEGRNRTGQYTRART